MLSMELYHDVQFVFKIKKVTKTLWFGGKAVSLRKRLWYGQDYYYIYADAGSACFLLC